MDKHIQGHAGVSHSFPRVATWFLLKFAYKPLFRKLRKLKLILCLGWFFLSHSKSEIRDDSLLLFIMPKENACWWMWFNYPDPVSSPRLFSTSYETEKATEGQTKPHEGFNVRSWHGRNRGCQKAGRDNDPVAFTGLNCSSFFVVIIILQKS